MIFSEVLQRFIVQSPVTVMMRATLENVFSPAVIDEVFAQTARQQRSGELLFSTVVDLLSLVVMGARKSVNTAYVARREAVQVSVNSVYNKLNGVETNVSRELVRRTAERLRPVVRAMHRPAEPIFPGYVTKILDGNHLSATEHRVDVLRTTRSGPLPGQGLCVLEPDCMLIVDVVLCEDGHAQERRLLDEVLDTVQAQEVWLGDRNFCTTKFLFGIAAKSGYFVIRQHASTLSYELPKRRKLLGRVESGLVYEQLLRLEAPDGRRLKARRLTLALDAATENGETEIHVLTNLPRRFTGQQVVAAYGRRWTVEHAFQELEQSLAGEIRTLGYPPAALLAFSLALVMYNLLSTIKTALAKAHGGELPREKLSCYYLAEEISGAYRGLVIAVPARQFRSKFGSLGPRSMARTLLHLASQARLEQFRKTTRGPRKPRPKRTSGKINHHVSTAKLLAQRATKR
jgi:hypothetical protein